MIIIKLFDKIFSFIARACKLRTLLLQKSEANFNAFLEEMEKSKEMYLPKNENGEITIDINKVLLDPFTYLDKVYTSRYFLEYVKYACAAKKHQKVINNIFYYEMIISLVIAVIVHLLFNKILISFIVFAVILFVLYLIVRKYMKGEDYNDFYNRTIFKLIAFILGGYELTTSNTSNQITFESFSKNIKTVFDKIKVSNVKMGVSNTNRGEIADVELTRTVTTKNADGTTKTSTETVFNGVSISVDYNNSFGYLNGAIIEIREDDNFWSNISEDTIQSIYQSDKEFMFNTEILNKAFDCHIKGTNSFGDIDDLMERIHLVIEPSFEDKMIFLRNRFNTFNMTITDERINFNVNLSKSFYQKTKSGELFNSNKYKDKSKYVKIPSSTLKNANDFMYYNIFPIVEQLYYIHYFNNLVNMHLNKNNIIRENNNILMLNNNFIKLFEQNELIISEIEYKEFKEKYKETIENIYENSKEIVIDIGKE